MTFAATTLVDMRQSRIYCMKTTLLESGTFSPQCDFAVESLAVEIFAVAILDVEIFVVEIFYCRDF